MDPLVTVGKQDAQAQSLLHDDRPGQTGYTGTYASNGFLTRIARREEAAHFVIRRRITGQNDMWLFAWLDEAGSGGPLIFANHSVGHPQSDDYFRAPDIIHLRHKNALPGSQFIGDAVSWVSSIGRPRELGRQAVAFPTLKHE